MSDSADLDRVAQRAAELAAQRVNMQSQGISEERVRRIVEETVNETASRVIAPAVNKSVAETLSAFGIDATNRMDFMKDLIFLRDMRLLSSDSKKHVLLSLIGLVTAAVVGGFFAYAKLKT